MRASRDAAVGAALAMSRRLSGAGGAGGGGAPWQRVDPLRGLPHSPAPHLAAHVFQVRHTTLKVVCTNI